MTAFTLSDVARICKVPESSLRYWERTALLEENALGSARRSFGFHDLVTVRTLAGLLRRGVPLRRIRTSVEAARERLPELERPLGALRAAPDGSEHVLIRHEGSLLEPDGQLALDFARSDAADATPIAPPRTADAVQWFEFGCKLDSDRDTYGEAIEAYRLAIEADPRFADAHCNLGSVYFNQGRRDPARDCFERALGFEPGHLEANLNAAALFEEDGADEAALHHYKVALESDPLYADTHVSLALLYEKLSLPRRGRKHWRRYLQLDPGGAWGDIARRRLAGGA